MSSVPLVVQGHEGYVLRDLRSQDAAALAAAYARNREYLAPWEPVRAERFFTEAGQEEAVAANLATVTAGLGSAWVLTFEEEVVGRLNLNNAVRGVFQSASVGYWVDQKHAGRGLASAAVEVGCVEARALGLHRLEAGTLLDNVASQQVLLRSGFEQIGTAPRYLFIAGSWQDHHLYQRVLHDDPAPA